VFIVTFYSIFVFGKWYQLFHWVGLFLVFTGVVIVGLAGVKSGVERGSSIFGIALIIIATMISSMISVTEEFILKNYTTHPLRMIGFMGMMEWPSLTFILLIMSL